MKKKVLFLFSSIICLCLGVTQLNAAGNRVEMVDQTHGVKQLSTDGAYIYNYIDTTNSDFVQGNVKINITIGNVKKAEVVYALDNDSSMNSIRNNLVTALKREASNLDNISNIKQAIVYTTNGTSETTLLSDNTITNDLDTFVSDTSSTGTNEIITSLQSASQLFTDDAHVKAMVIIVGSVPTEESDITALTNAIADYIANDIKIIVYGIDLTGSSIDETVFNAIYTNCEKNILQTNEFSNLLLSEDVIDYLPTEKTAVSTTISFDNYILNNFDIKDIKLDREMGQANYDETTHILTWQAGLLNPNEVINLTYTLALKSVVDESIVNSVLRTNRQINVSHTSPLGTQTGTFPSNETIEDEICSPTIKVLQEAITNPNTGILETIIIGSVMMCIALITIVILNNKKQFINI